MPEANYVLVGVICGVIIVALVAAFACVDYCADMNSIDDKVDDNESVSSGTSRSSSVRKKRKMKIEGNGDSGSDTSSLLEDGSNIKTDMALMDTFVSVLTQGIQVKLHTTDKPPKDVKLSLENTTIIWRSLTLKGLRAMGGYNKTSRTDLSEIRKVVLGKKTSTLKQPMSASTPEDFCLSLLMQGDRTLDIEVSSKVERDSFAQGFSILVHTLNDHDDMI